MSFEKKGPESKADLIYPQLVPLTIGEGMSYAQLEEVAPNFLKQRGPFYTARRWLLQRHQRTLENVPGYGYVVVDAPRQIEIAQQYNKRARRSIREGARNVVHIDRNRLNVEQRQQAESHAAGFHAVGILLLGIIREQKKHREDIDRIIGALSKTGIEV